jgi:hypothetical protein
MIRYPLIDLPGFEDFSCAETQQEPRSAARRWFLRQGTVLKSFRYFWDRRCYQPTAWLRECSRGLCAEMTFVLRCLQSLHSSPLPR